MKENIKFVYTMMTIVYLVMSNKMEKKKENIIIRAIFIFDKFVLFLLIK